MKIVLIFAIELYQKILSPVIKSFFGISKMCRLSPTCSEYAKKEINKNGIIFGLGRSALRILRCQPFSKN